MKLKEPRIGRQLVKKKGSVGSEGGIGPTRNPSFFGLWVNTRQGSLLRRPCRGSQTSTNAVACPIRHLAVMPLASQKPAISPYLIAMETRRRKRPAGEGFRQQPPRRAKFRKKSAPIKRVSSQSLSSLPLYRDLFSALGFISVLVEDLKRVWLVFSSKKRCWSE